MEDLRMNAGGFCRGYVIRPGSPAPSLLPSAEDLEEIRRRIGDLWGKALGDQIPLPGIPPEISPVQVDTRCPMTPEKKNLSHDQITLDHSRVRGVYWTHDDRMIISPEPQPESR
jgi:hypothetical protein